MEAAELATPTAEQTPSQAEASMPPTEVAPRAEQPAGEPVGSTAVHPVITAPQPEGRKRSLDGIDYYEAQPGYYEVWIHGRIVGDVQRLSRAPVLGARLYGDRVVAPVTHYQATVGNRKRCSTPMISMRPGGKWRADSLSCRQFPGDMRNSPPPSQRYEA
jgi:hypothetical protein